MVQIIDDMILESPERFWIGLRFPLGGKLGGIDTATVFIEDDEVLLSFEQTEYKVPESSNTLQIKLSRTGFTGPLTLDLNAGHLDRTSAIKGEDFDIPSVISFPDGIDSVDINVTIINDEIKESRESFNLEVSRDGDVIGSVSVSIVDNDDGNVQPKAEGLSETVILLIAVVVVIFVIAAIIGTICIALCIRELGKKSSVVLRPRAIPLYQLRARPVRPII